MHFGQTVLGDFVEDKNVRPVRRKRLPPLLGGVDLPVAAVDPDLLALLQFLLEPGLNSRIRGRGNWWSGFVVERSPLNAKSSLVLVVESRRGVVMQS